MKDAVLPRQSLSNKKIDNIDRAIISGNTVHFCIKLCNVLYPMNCSVKNALPKLHQVLSYCRLVACLRNSIDGGPNSNSVDYTKNSRNESRALKAGEIIRALRLL